MVNSGEQISRRYDDKESRPIDKKYGAFEGGNAESDREIRSAAVRRQPGRRRGELDGQTVHRMQPQGC